MHDEQTNPEEEPYFNLLKAHLENLQARRVTHARKIIANVTEIKRGTPCDYFSKEREETLLNSKEPK